MIRLLSIDILFGVISSYIFAAVLLESELHLLVPLILCLAVWLVYTLDHLSDASYLGTRAVKPVYRWHWEKRRVLLAISAFLFLLALSLSLLYLPPGILLTGLAGAALLTVYLLVHSHPGRRRGYLFKEFWVGGIYTMGIWGLPVLYRNQPVQPVLVLIIISFFCLVMVNVLTYSYFEQATDRKENLPTFAVRFGPRSCRTLITYFLVTGAMLALTGMFLAGRGRDFRAAGILLLMSLVLSFLYIFPAYFGRKGRFGILADAVFLLPCLIFLQADLQISF